MPALKKILVSVPEELLRATDELSAREGISRSAFIRRALGQSIDLLHTMETREKMKRGYEEMAGINLEWAEIGVSHDRNILDAYEENLSESENHGNKR